MSHSIVYESWTFPADKIKEGNLYLATSLLASSLEVNSFVPVVECDDPAILDFQRNAKLLYYAEPGRPMVFRVQNIKRVGPKLYEITATSTLGLLTEGQHMGGIYTGQEAEEVILDICGTVPVEIKNNLKKIKLYGWLPIAAPRDNLAQVLFAIGAALKTDLDGVLRVETLWDGISGQVPQDNMYTDANVDYSARITQVIVTEHQYIPWTEEKQLFEGTAQAGDVITFDEPMHDLAAEGFTILASGANWAKVSAGSGTLTGKTYIHNTRQVSKAVQEAGTPNVKTVENATLVSLANSSAVAQRLADYYRCRELIDAPVVYRGESPGDRLATWHPFDKTGVDACLESADITLSNTLKAQEKLLVGYVPPQAGDVEYFDTTEEITEDGEWEVPDGVTEITAVCIGGGWGGYSGYPGDKMSYPPPDYKNVGSEKYVGYNAGYGAEGGLGGAPGSGGRILVGNLNVQPHQKFQAHIGVGGKGGGQSSSGSNVGIEGSPTTFGSFTSADGSPNPSGYTDILTGKVYALQGELSGIAGGKGSGGDPNSSTGYLKGTSITDRQGNVWSAGNITSSSENAVLDTGGRVYAAQAGRGCGGGPAVGSNGRDGQKGTVSGSDQYGVPSIAIGGASGNGADAVKAEPQLKQGGFGGHGGHGGGGEGGTGLAVIWNPVSIDKFSVNRGRPGYGGEGGDGGKGIILLHYRKPKKSPAGQLVDKNNKMVLDRLGRRTIM